MQRRCDAMTIFVLVELQARAKRRGVVACAASIRRLLQLLRIWMSQHSSNHSRTPTALSHNCGENSVTYRADSRESVWNIVAFVTEGVTDVRQYYPFSPMQADSRCTKAFF